MYEPQMLPDPTFVVKIPSIDDGTLINCRLHHPACQDGQHALTGSVLGRRIAVLAHPYAPMGGCSDDPVVNIVGGQLLEKGFIVGTFDFRGAGCSAGRTSWTANAEKADFTSFIGFLVHYVHLFRSPCAPRETQPLAVQLVEDAERPLLLIGGYSYGAMITTQLAPLDDLLKAFESPEPGSHAAQICHEASKMAGIARRALEFEVAVSTAQLDTAPSAGSRAQAEAEAAMAAAAAAELPSSSTAENPTLESSCDIKIPKAAYLLISPPAPRGLVSVFTTLSILPSALTSTFTFSRRRSGSISGSSASAKGLTEEKLVRNSTLAVYGDADALVSVGKLRSWAQDLTARPGSLFCGREIKSAGHFWSEEGVLSQLMDSVNDFADRLLQQRGES